MYEPPLFLGLQFQVQSRFLRLPICLIGTGLNQLAPLINTCGSPSIFFHHQSSRLNISLKALDSALKLVMIGYDQSQTLFLR